MDRTEEYDVNDYVEPIQDYEGEEYVPEDETIQEEIRRNSRTTSSSTKKTTTRRAAAPKKEKSMFETVAEKAATSFGRTVANALARGILGSLLKK